MSKIECETCIKRKTRYCPNSSECLETEDMPHYKNRIMILEENELYKTLLMKDHHKIHELADVIDEVEKSLKDYQEYIDEAKKMYSDLDDDNIVKVSCMQILNNQMARNYDLLQILEKVNE